MTRDELKKHICQIIKESDVKVLELLKENSCILNNSISEKVNKLLTMNKQFIWNESSEINGSSEEDYYYEFCSLLEDIGLNPTIYTKSIKNKLEK